MLGKAFSLALVILGVYILGGFIYNIGSGSSSQPGGTLYHIGCYDANHTLYESTSISQYLQTLALALAPHSVQAVRQVQTYAQEHHVDPKGANAVALQFKKYIVALENIKNLNQYEQNYHKGVRDARDDFYYCRENFRAREWDCRGTYDRYLRSDENFNTIKGNLTDLVFGKFEEQSQIEKLLQPQEYDEHENETYYKLMREFDRNLSIIWDFIKRENETLTGLENKQYREIHALHSSRKQLQECQNNYDQVEVCEKINQEIKKIDYGLLPQDIQIRIDGKREIIERYESAHAKSMKVGIDTTQIKEKLTQNKKQLETLYQLFAEAETQNICASQIVIKCSKEQIVELQKNITILEASLQTIRVSKIQIKTFISNSKLASDQIEERKKQATKDYQNSIGSLDKIKQLEAYNLQRLRFHRDNINLYNQNISAMQSVFQMAEDRRKAAISDLDNIVKRVSELTACLAKKDYLLQLQSKQPAKRQEDVQMKRKAAESLIKALRNAYK